MAQITLHKVWTPGEVVAANDINTNFSRPYQQINGNLDNSNIATEADIEESKLKFSTATGHDHDGVNSKLIPKGYAVAVVGTLSTGTSVTPAMIALSGQSITKVYAYVKTAPSGSSILIDINKNGVSIWNANQSRRVAIAAGATSGTQTSFDTTTFSESDIITFDIDQVGSSNPGADLTIVIR